MPKRERKRPKAVRAWASYNDSGAIRESRTFPRRRICDCYWGRSSTQRVLIVPLSGKVLMDETHDCRSTAETYILASEAAKGKRIRVLVLEEKP